MAEQGRKAWDKWITDEHRRRAVDLLVRRQRRRTGDRPRLVNDYVLGRAAGVPGKSRETIRRRARELRKALDQDGLPIVVVPGSKGGAYLAETSTDHRLYAELLAAEGRRKLARAAALKRSRDAADAGGQYSMFDLSADRPRHRF